MGSLLEVPGIAVVDRGGEFRAPSGLVVAKVFLPS